MTCDTRVLKHVNRNILHAGCKKNVKFVSLKRKLDIRMLVNAAPVRPLVELQRLRASLKMFKCKRFINKDDFFCRWWTLCLSSPTQPSHSKLGSGLWKQSTQMLEKHGK